MLPVAVVAQTFLRGWQTVVPADTCGVGPRYHLPPLLAGSSAGPAARQIADRVRLQGPDGIHERRHREVSGAPDRSETDNWSPDGRLGRLS